MTTSVVLRRGDDLDCLTALNAEAEDRGLATSGFEDFMLNRPGSARALIVGVDLTACDRVREVKKALRRIERQIDDSCELLEGDAHVYVVLSGVAASTSRVVPIYEAMAERLHALAGSAHGIEITSTVIDCTSCTDKGLLAERIMGDVASRDDNTPTAALTWDELADSSISEAALNEFL